MTAEVASFNFQNNHATRLCKKCCILKPIDRFRTRTDRARETTSTTCRECCKENDKKWNRISYNRNRKKRRADAVIKYYARGREQTLVRKYGVTQAKYEEMLEKQNGGCGICDAKPMKRALCVDHDHKTGVVRGLLCRSCNQALGKFGDSVESLRRVMHYLESVVS